MDKKKTEQLSKNIDSKGRIALGKAFANKSAIVQYFEDGQILIRIARVIPESEAWLYNQDEALSLVRQGLIEAQEGDLTTFDLEESFTFAEAIPEEE